jgi:hypothetical protein
MAGRAKGKSPSLSACEGLTMDLSALWAEIDELIAADSDEDVR